MTQLSVSQAEKYFITNNAYKRSRKYFDIVKLNHIQQQLERERRIPLSSKETIQSRVGQSFISSNELLHDKVNNDLDLFHKKLLKEDVDQIETSYTARTNRANTIDMRKMIARNQLGKNRQAYRNQEQFNNYSVTFHKPRFSLDFQKSTGRVSNTNRYQDPQDINGQTISKIYQRLLFDQSNLTCFVDYKKNGKFNPKPQSDICPFYDSSKLRRGESLTKKNVFAQELQFYQGNGKTDPSQLDNRILKEGEYFWRGVRQERERVKDFAASKRREDQQKKKIEVVLSRRKPIDERQQMCDQKYFRRHY